MAPRRPYLTNDAVTVYQPPSPPPPGPNPPPFASVTQQL